MTPRFVRFTATARRHVPREKTWWIENRVHIDVFAAELEDALKFVAFVPAAGTTYSQAGVAGFVACTCKRSIAISITRSMIARSSSERFGVRDDVQDRG